METTSEYLLERQSRASLYRFNLATYHRHWPIVSHLLSISGCIYDYASQLKSSYKAGHQLMSHTWRWVPGRPSPSLSPHNLSLIDIFLFLLHFNSHADVTTLSSDDLNKELAQLEKAFKKILGVKVSGIDRLVFIPFFPWPPALPSFSHLHSQKLSDHLTETSTTQLVRS